MPSSAQFVAFVTARQAAPGLPGTGLAALAFVVAGNAVSGGTVPFAFLPDGFRQVAPWLPNGAIVSAARDAVYLPGSDLGHPLLALGSEPAPPMTGTTGDIEALSMWAGQDVALAKKTQPAADIVAELTSRL